jgi:hypothetical protein
MMPLSPPQQQVALCGFTPAVSPQLAADSSDWLAMDMNGMYIKKELDIW